jgi:FAD/FMN-containing dehydrogenase
MARFRDIVVNEEEGTVEIGAGLTWTEVYSYLVPKGLNVVGGRIDSVGVGGFTLGGGTLPACRSTSYDILGRPISMVSQ